MDEIHGIEVVEIWAAPHVVPFSRSALACRGSEGAVKLEVANTKVTQRDIQGWAIWGTACKGDLLRQALRATVCTLCNLRQPTVQKDSCGDCY